MEYSDAFVVLMGVGTVFFGLICLIVLLWVMGRLFRGVEQPAPAAPARITENAPSNGGEILAAISAAVAEELGTDVSAFRIVSVKKL